ncbi:membrane protein insertion efficiency factor YidD [Pseudonocardia sp. TRM90224]|uniref:membrane protein insertion efficiency factor YidD n=1 Tax=Pseudonocardia sp. TRM90224 TaxID=2812678 RepID=UPI001E53EF56|nr:membrane protein insertion efficiency factor YidD [Pseudonocardia sp. TRM90224]
MAQPEQDDDSSGPWSDRAEAVGDLADGADAASSACDIGGCDGCGGCDCNLLLRLSSVMLFVAALVPEAGGGVVLSAIRGYRRWLTRFTPRCPAPVSCSAFALDAVERLGPRRGLVAAAGRVRRCRR